ncbi:class I SAM-dependent methyltransferase [Gordonia polyisoprenivorans]|uniref:class I SAM-dependent methyltransferase n=1 Tax=Gordonia polyisoprenivorans TaxID=84595 RepID=UPI001AD7A52E|nr:class I SAM-dependent methyltransferase [Gordonia polyisoprenivorans]QTI68485.1 methyltransferase domain-containing protein [Gordonia polyisoprenivorans]
MTTSQPSHLDRRRAESFGPVADAYDRYRPPFPPEVIERLLPVPGMTVLDVGAGTGMVSAPMAAAGANVLAVEPDPLMAEKARAKGIVVEEATFEEWDARGRTFDLVVFARSFHWVDPQVALARIPSLLNPDGRLALLWNRAAAVEPSEARIREIYREVCGADAVPTTREASRAEDRAHELLTSAGLTPTIDRFAVETHVSTEDYVNLAFTYSRQLTLDADTAARLRSRLTEFLGPDGVRVRNSTVALVCRVPAAA